MDREELPKPESIDEATAKRAESKGIRFVLAEEGDIDKTYKLFITEYILDEPLGRSSFARGNDDQEPLSIIEQTYNMMFMDYNRERVEKDVRAGTTVLAIDSQGDVIGNL